MSDAHQTIDADCRPFAASVQVAPAVLCVFLHGYGDALIASHGG